MGGVVSGKFFARKPARMVSIGRGDRAMDVGARGSGDGWIRGAVFAFGARDTEIRFHPSHDDGRTMSDVFFTQREVRNLAGAVDVLRDGREAVLRDWVERVREHQAMQTGQLLSEPLLLDHIPQLFDAILDRLEIDRPREDAEAFAVVHGFTRRLSGYDVVETVLELLMFRRAIWSHLVAVNAKVDGAYAAMEQIDGMVDRAVLTSLSAFLDPAARLLEMSDGRSEDGAGEE
jgi:RsbT co-antagonist protein rsbRD N-terminal domain